MCLYWRSRKKIDCKRSGTACYDITTIRSFRRTMGRIVGSRRAGTKGIAERMLLHYPEIFVDSARIEAIASYIPRCISSMNAFLSGMENRIPHW